MVEEYEEILRFTRGKGQLPGPKIKESYAEDD